MSKRPVLEAYKEAADFLKDADVYAIGSGYTILKIENRAGIEHTAIFPRDLTAELQKEHGVHVLLSEGCGKKIDAGIAKLIGDKYAMNKEGIITKKVLFFDMEIAKRSGRSFLLYKGSGAEFVDDLLDAMECE